MARHSVEFTNDNIDICLCGDCPVQASSDCAAEKMRAMKPATASDLADPSAPADVPRAYCSSGKATCTDLDFGEGCICPSCAVYDENSLGDLKYCEQGSAAEVD